MGALGWVSHEPEGTRGWEVPGLKAGTIQPAGRGV
jgi:hypothetical protein